jgi:hypothetical protein
MYAPKSSTLSLVLPLPSSLLTVVNRGEIEIFLRSDASYTSVIGTEVRGQS